MAEEHKHEESIMEKIAEKIHGHDDGSSSSSSDSDDDKKSASLKTKIYRLFGREQPLHKVFGGGKRMDPLSFHRLAILVTISYRIWILAIDCVVLLYAYFRLRI